MNRVQENLLAEKPSPSQLTVKVVLHDLSSATLNSILKRTILQNNNKYTCILQGICSKSECKESGMAVGSPKNTELRFVISLYTCV